MILATNCMILLALARKSRLDMVMPSPPRFSRKVMVEIPPVGKGDYTSTTATLIDKLPEGATIEEGYENTLPIGLTNFVHSEVAIGTSFLNPDISGFLLGALRLTGILKISVITLAGKSLAFYQPWMAIRPTGVISPIGLVWT